MSQGRDDKTQSKHIMLRRSILSQYIIHSDINSYFGIWCTVDCGMLYGFCVRVVYAKRGPLSSPWANMAHRIFTCMELLFNLTNVHSRCGTTRMQLDSLRWIRFPTPLNSKQRSCPGLLDATLRVYACSLKGEGGGVEVGGRPWPWDTQSPSNRHSLVFRTNQIQPHRSPPRNHGDLRENATDSPKSRVVKSQPAAHQPSRDVC